MSFSYNIHPIVVHFPIALLTLYSLLEIISVGRLKNKSEMFWTKFILVTTGGITLLVARQAGSVAKHLVSDHSLYPLISRHEQFANYSTAVFGVIAAGYMCIALRRLNWRITTIVPVFWEFLYGIGDIITSNYLAKLLALVGIIALTITGALGGTIVYGQNNDPFTNFIYHLVIK